MSLLICTPIHGFPVMPYTQSMEALQEALLQANLEHNFLYIKGESLVQRARNNAVRTFLKTPYERLLFIDADIEFDPEDVAKLYNLDENICGGSYPMKKPGVKTTAWKDGKLVDLESLSEPTEVDYLGTGFMMIRRCVFEEMKLVFPEKRHYEGNPNANPATIGELKKNGFSYEMEESFAWFDPRVSYGETPEDRIYWSEDYAFCFDAQRSGFKVILEPSIKLTHWGMYGFADSRLG